MSWKYRLGQRVEVRWKVPTMIGWREVWREGRIDAQVSGTGYEVSFPDENHCATYPCTARDIREPKEATND